MVTRTGWNDDSWGADQRTGVDQALRVNTIDGAYAPHEEAIEGSIAPGKLALAAAEAEGGSFTTDDVRRHARDHLDRLSLTPTR
jgi:predicted amidohydrolase YtcJ